jgi:hypothetical protein
VVDVARLRRLSPILGNPGPPAGERNEVQREVCRVCTCAPEHHRFVFQRTARGGNCPQDGVMRTERTAQATRRTVSWASCCIVAAVDHLLPIALSRRSCKHRGATPWTDSASMISPGWLGVA